MGTILFAAGNTPCVATDGKDTEIAVCAVIQKSIPMDNHQLACFMCTYVNKEGNVSCEMCGEKLVKENKNKACKLCPKCPFYNAIEAVACQVCDHVFDHVELKQESDDFNMHDYFRENANLYLQCPNVSCKYYIEVRNPGFIEHVQCPGCGMSFCSQCKGLFHGIPPLSFLKSGRSLSQFEERLTCAGAANIIQRWNEYKVINDFNFTSSDCKQKHHVNVSEFYEDKRLVRRMPTHEYRLKCCFCTSDIIGPRFRCIHCAQGYNLCLGCISNDEVPTGQSVTHSLTN